MTIKTHRRNLLKPLLPHKDRSGRAGTIIPRKTKLVRPKSPKRVQQKIRYYSYVIIILQGFPFVNTFPNICSRFFGKMRASLTATPYLLDNIQLSHTRLTLSSSCQGNEKNEDLICLALTPKHHNRYSDKYDKGRCCDSAYRSKAAVTFSCAV